MPAEGAAAKPAAGGNKALKIILSILGGCVVLVVVVGIIGFFALKNAVNTFEDGLETDFENILEGDGSYSFDEEYGADDYYDDTESNEEVREELDALFESIGLDVDTGTGSSSETSSDDGLSEFEADLDTATEIDSR